VVRRLTATAAAVVLAGVSMAAAGPAPVRFPRDHFGHPSASIEWWYFTALAHDAAGNPYSVFFTLFSSEGTLVPVAQVRNLKTGAVVGHSEQLALGRVSSTSLDVRAGGAELRYRPGSSLWSFSVSAPGFSVALRQRPEKPYTLNGGGTGVIRQSSAEIAHYYSATRMTATGTLRVGGRSTTLAGESWLDHQWGNFRNDPRAFNWDWFSCRFDDHSELMLYQFRDRVTGRPLPAFGNGMYTPRRGQPVGVTGFQARPGRRALDAAGRHWPLDWRIRVPELRLTENLRSLLPDQLVRNRLLPTFWEGAATAGGSRTGTCFVELSYR
jgi:predicted secreted hydrolase